MDETVNLRPNVKKPRPRLRLGFVVALLVAMAAGMAVLLLERGHREERVVSVPSLRDHCTPLEVELASRSLPAGERAVCWAIAGRIDRAREEFARLTGDEHTRAVQELFDIAHPIADAGDDRSAGPIMELIVEMWPQNYMAVFHAGMAEFALGEDEVAKRNFERFLGMYNEQTVWRQRAIDALAAIDQHVPISQRVAHFRE